MSTLKMQHNPMSLYFLVALLVLALPLLNPISVEGRSGEFSAMGESLSTEQCDEGVEGSRVLSEDFFSQKNHKKSPYGTLSVTEEGDITYVVISHPPINLYDHYLASDMYGFMSSLVPGNRTTPPPKIVIFRSADPDFFIAHLDLTWFFPPFEAENFALYSNSLNLLQNLTTTVFIAELDGIASGAGSELLLQMDMRFAGPKANFGSIETSLGLSMAGGGMEYMTAIVNKGRAMQYLLSGDSVYCKTGKEIGLFNDCYETKEELYKNVGALAKRIALRPAAALTATKFGVRSIDPPQSAILADFPTFQKLSASMEVQDLLHKFKVLDKNQTRSLFELGLQATLGELFKPLPQ